MKVVLKNSSLVFAAPKEKEIIGVFEGNVESQGSWVTLGMLTPNLSANTPFYIKVETDKPVTTLYVGSTTSNRYFTTAARDTFNTWLQKDVDFIINKVNVFVRTEDGVSAVKIKVSIAAVE